MSINITIAVPLETVIALDEAVASVVDIEAIVNATSKTMKAVIDAVKALPCDIKSKPTIHNVASAAIPTVTIRTPTSSEMFAEQGQGKDIGVTVRLLSGKLIPVRINSKARASSLAKKVESQEGIPADQQCFILLGKMFLGHCQAKGHDAIDMSLDEAGVTDGTVIHLVLRLRSS